MFRVEVRLTESQQLYEFLEDTLTDARRLAEEIGREGFWLDDAEPALFVPPSRIELVQIFPKRK